MSKGSGLPLFLSLSLSFSVCLSEGTSIYTCVGINITKRSVKGKETANSITTQDVKGQMHIKVLQISKGLVKGLREETNLVKIFMTIVSIQVAVCHEPETKTDFLLFF